MTTVLAAASLFLVLVGVGKALVPAPGNTLGIWLFVAGAGLALVPVWTARLRRA